MAEEAREKMHKVAIEKIKQLSAMGNEAQMLCEIIKKSKIAPKDLPEAIEQLEGICSERQPPKYLQELIEDLKSR